MRRSPGAGDEHLQASPFGRRGVLSEQLRSPVRRHDAHLVGDVELVEYLGRERHDLPVRAAPHHDADERLHRPLTYASGSAKGSANGSAAPVPTWATSSCGTNAA